MSKYKVCKYCNIAFNKDLDKCPKCKRPVADPDMPIYEDKEGEGRAHHAGGEACDYCPHCYGSADWCPIMDND